VNSARSWIVNSNAQQTSSFQSEIQLETGIKPASNLLISVESFKLAIKRSSRHALAGTRSKLSQMHMAFDVPNLNVPRSGSSSNSQAFSIIRCTVWSP
jgi:hypothetical protein